MSDWLLSALLILGGVAAGYSARFLERRTELAELERHRALSALGGDVGAGLPVQQSRDACPCCEWNGTKVSQLVACQPGTRVSGCVHGSSHSHAQCPACGGWWIIDPS